VRARCAGAVGAELGEGEPAGVATKLQIEAADVAAVDADDGLVAGGRVERL
jgi:hypothetical protein